MNKYVAGLYWSLINTNRLLPTVAHSLPPVGKTPDTNDPDPPLATAGDRRRVETAPAVRAAAPTSTQMEVGIRLFVPPAARPWSSTVACSARSNLVADGRWGAFEVLGDVDDAEGFGDGEVLAPSDAGGRVLVGGPGRVADDAAGLDEPGTVPEGVAGTIGVAPGAGMSVGACTPTFGPVPVSLASGNPGAVVGVGEVVVGSCGSAHTYGTGGGGALDGD